MSWQAAAIGVLLVALAAGFGWYERSRPPATLLPSSNRLVDQMRQAASRHSRTSERAARRKAKRGAKRRRQRARAQR